MLGSFLITNFMKHMILEANIKELEGFSAYHDCPQWYHDLNRYLSPVQWFGCDVSQTITGWKQVLQYYSTDTTGPECTALVSLVLTGEPLYHLWDPPARRMLGPGNMNPNNFLL